MTALPKLIFDKQLAALGQLQNLIGSLKPAKSKSIGLGTRTHPVMVTLGKRGRTRDSLLQALHYFVGPEGCRQSIADSFGRVVHSRFGDQVTRQIWFSARYAGPPL